MSVHRRKGSPYYHYEFEFQCARFRGSTKQTTERAAEKVEARIRAEVEDRARAGHALKSTTIQMTLGDACSRFWLEKGQHEADQASVFYQLENLVDGLGKNVLLSAITMSDLAEYQARRRGQVNRHGRLPANKSINAECPSLIARVYKRARTVWSDSEGGVTVATGPDRDWTRLRLRIPKERRRELSADEQTKLWQELREDYQDLIEFAIITGLRRAALLLTWDQVDLAAGKIVYARKSMQDGDMGELPISDRMRQLLVAQIDRHKRSVWTYVARRTAQGKRRGRRYPITQEGLRTEMTRSVKDAGIKDWRAIHDLRHTAASRTLRVTQNLKLVQIMLGHAEIASTARYAHVLQDDVRAAMDATTPLKNPAIVETDGPAIKKSA